MTGRLISGTRAWIGHGDVPQRLGMVAALATICVIASVQSEFFFTWSNAANLARAVALIGIVSIGQTVVLISGNIDLSVGAIAGISGVVLALTQDVGGIVPAAVLAIVTGAFIGLIHGLITVKTGINSLIVTLATMTTLRGVIYIATNGFPLPIHSVKFSQILWTTVAQVPFPTMIMAGLLVVGYFVLSWTPFGSSLYAAGGNPRAATEAGINVSRKVIAVFVISGVCAAIAGVLLAARFGSAAADAGQGWELMSIAAVVIGGTSLFGGRGELLGTLLGVLLLGAIANAMNLLSIDSFYQQVVQGLLILIAVGASTLRQRGELSVNA